ncbi:MAG: hypothetical protein ACM359_01230, partial [Bacillota bacterium]
VVSFLREKSNINLLADWKILESVGVTPDTPITVSVSDVPLKEVLRLVLHAAADNLAYDIEGGVLTLTTTEVADRQLFIKVYDISNLVDDPAANVNAYSLSDLERQLQQAEIQRSVKAKELGETHRDIARRDNTIDAIKKQIAQANQGSRGGSGSRPDDKAQQLAAVITSTVSPGSWAESGGPGSIKTFNTKLVIATTKSNHESIETLLKLLRSDPTAPTDPTPTH